MSNGRGADLSDVGVVGAGTMGAGIAQLGALGGYDVHLHDPDADALDRGLQGIRAGLTRGAGRGRWSEADAEAAAARLHPVASLDGLAPAELVVEAAPEDLELKRELFAALAEVVGEGCVLATNTSSLSVTSLAAAVPAPERVVGMHFFNPPVLMKLVEVVAGERSAPQSLDAVTAVAGRMGRTAIRARDAIGFVANRCARPFTLEALRMLGEGVAPIEGIDRAVRVGGGFRMGPFELMDLVGIDVNFAVARSFYEQSFGEPRWRPHPLHARQAASGRLGRKTGEGFYRYPEGGEHREADPEVDAERPIVDPDELSALAGPNAVEILERIGSQLANEACFALGERVASAEDINTAMRLGFNWPIGPLEWGERIGWPAVLDRLEQLRAIHGDGYRPAALVSRAVAEGTEPAAVGAGANG